jgi:hypothetical protein
VIYNFCFWRFQTSVQKFRVSTGQTALHQNKIRLGPGADLPRAGPASGVSRACVLSCAVGPAPRPCHGVPHCKLAPPHPVPHAHVLIPSRFSVVHAPHAVRRRPVPSRQRRPCLTCCPSRRPALPWSRGQAPTASKRWSSSSRRAPRHPRLRRQAAAVAPWPPPCRAPLSGRLPRRLSPPPAAPTPLFGPTCRGRSVNCDPFTCRTHLSGTTKSLVGGDLGVPMSHKPSSDVSAQRPREGHDEVLKPSTGRIACTLLGILATHEINPQGTYTIVAFTSEYSKGIESKGTCVY